MPRRDLPHGGGKAGIVADPKTCDKQRLVRAFAKAIRDLSEYIPGPDMGTDESCMAWIQDEIGRAVGLPRVLGGIPLDEIGATGYGLAVCAEVATEFFDLELNGSDCRHRRLWQRRQTCSSISGRERRSARCSQRHRRHDLRSGGYRRPRACESQRIGGQRDRLWSWSESSAHDEIFTQPCDILVPAARPDCIHADNAREIKAKLILQGANIPATPEAERILYERGILNMPDFICNAGGVICAAVEYHGGTERDAFEVIHEKITRNSRAVLTRCRDEKLQPRQAAVELARQRVKAAMEFRADT